MGRWDLKFFPAVSVHPPEGAFHSAVLGDGPPKSRDRLRDLGIGHVGQWNRLTVEYAGWVRIVGT
jgi:hypothetical protein